MPALRGFLIVSGYFRLWVRVWVSGFSQTELPGKGRGRLWGNRRFLPHQSEAENRPQARVLHELQNPVLQKEKRLPNQGAFSFWS